MHGPHVPPARSSRPTPLGFFRATLAELSEQVARLRAYLDTLPAAGSPDPIAQLGPGGDFVRELRPCGKCGRTFSTPSKSHATTCHACTFAEMERVRFEAAMLRRDNANAVACLKVRPASEWHEDDGPVLWWRDDVIDSHASPYFGTPLDSGWVHENVDGRLEWWSELPDFRPLLTPAEREKIRLGESRGARVECASCTALYTPTARAIAAGNVSLCSMCFARTYPEHAPASPAASYTPPDWKDAFCSGCNATMFRSDGGTRVRLSGSRFACGFCAKCASNEGAMVEAIDKIRSNGHAEWALALHSLAFGSLAKPPATRADEPDASTGLHTNQPPTPENRVDERA